MNTYFNFIDTAMIDASLKEGKFPFSKYLFWDTPIENIDLSKHKKYIIERVLTKGFLQDFYVLQKLYTKIEIVEVLKKSKVLDPKTANFCSHYYNLPLNDLYVSSFYD